MSALITPDYLAQQKALHAAPKGYGGKGDKWAGEVHRMAASGETILDYGCGQGSLGRALRGLGYEVRDYDPAIPGKDVPPPPADLVVCTDVLEHIEPACIDAVLDDLKRVTRKALFVVIALTPAGKVLPDGRNAHILLRPADWWADMLGRRFAFDRSVPCREHKEIAQVWRPSA